MSREINLLDILERLVKHRWLIVKIVLIVTIISLGLSLIWPKSYKSTVRFFPPPRERGSLGGVFGNFFQPVVTTSQLNSEALLVILYSRSLKEHVIQKFNLSELYGTDIQEVLLKKVEAHMQINELREGGFGFNPITAIEFSYIDKDPVRTEKITDYIVTKLDSIVKGLNKERAESTVQHIEARYRKNLNDLREAEKKLKEFQEKNGIFEIETQTKSLIEKLAELKAELIQLDIKINILKQTTSSENIQLKQLREQRNATHAQYTELVSKQEKLNKNEVFHPLSEMPELAVQYARLYREVTVQNKIYETIYPQYEQAKLQASMQSQGIQILDPARLPTYKFKPKRLYIVLAGFIFAVFLSFVLILFKELWENEKIKDSQNYHKLLNMKNTLIRDFKIWQK